MLVIKSYNECYRKQWDDFVAGVPEGSLFHLIGWKNAVERTYGHKSHYIMAMEGDEIRGILPLIEMKSRLFGHSLVSVPYGVYGGIAACDAEAHETLTKSAEMLADLMKVDYLELRNVSGQSYRPENRQAGATDHQVQLAKWFSKDLYVTFRKPILPTVAENMNAIPRKQRAMVRKGEKSGLESRIGGVEDLAQFYAIYARNVRDLGSPVYPPAFFRSLMENFSDSFILSVWKDGTMVAGVLTFVFKGILMPYYGGGRRGYFDYAVNDFMYWELMKYGCENGFTTFDFGRSKRDVGSYRFKKHWGFEPAPLDYRCYLVNAKEVPNVSPVNPKYQLMITVWKRLPLSVTNWLGPKLVKGIP
jgi:FemAB-related protein (PEP-CTERM system-associated)